MKKVNCFIIFFCCFLLLAQPLLSFAAFGSQDKGTAAAQFLKLGVGARAIGMGEAYSAVADESSAIYWNPAGLTRIKDRSATFMHALLLDSIVYDYLSYGQKISDWNAIGASIQNLSAGTMKETDSSGFETGTSFNPRDFAVTLGYSHRISNFSLGVSGKYIRCEIIDSASTFAADAGVLMSPGFLEKKLLMALVVQNIGGKLKFDQESDPLPLNIKMGGSLSIHENWTTALDLNFPRDNNPNVALGTEYRIPYDTDWEFFGRLGFNSRTIGDVSGFTGFATGFGSKFRQFQLDYAFVPVGTIGLTHYISLSVSF